jgi:hypothetical protein
VTYERRPTLESFLRSFTWGNVLQLQKVHPGIPGGTGQPRPGKHTLALIDIDSHQKRSAGTPSRAWR